MRHVPAVYGLVAGAALLVYFFTGSNLQTFVLVGEEAGAVIAIAVGVVRFRPRPVRPWLFLIGSQLIFGIAWAFWEAHILSTGAPANPDALISFFFQPGYPLLAIALFLLLYQREPDAVAAVDAAIVSIALFVPAAVLLFYNYAVDGRLPVAWRIDQIGFGVFDVFILAAVLRLLVSTGRRTPAFALLLGGAVAWLFSDFIWNWSIRLGSYLPGRWADTGWLLSPILIGLAALRPEMTRLFVRHAAEERRLRLDRFLMLVAASLVAPIALIYDVVTHEKRGELAVVAAASAALSVFVLVRLMLVLRDERQSAAAAIERERLLARERDQNVRLRDLDRMKDDFVASVSHELRTPLTSIRGYLELILDGEAGEVTDEQEQFLGIVQRNADRLLRVVGDLLFVAQVDAGKIALEPGECDLDALARESVDVARPAADEKEILLEVTTDSGRTLEADRARLAQVLDNLVSNAVKFTPPGGRVAIRTFRHRNEAVIEVSDTGMGIGAEDQERLFERFFRTRAASDRAIQGTGLGLAIVKAIVEAHGGTISVDSKVGEGTTFRVVLPGDRERVAA